jgi:hypothetical protein
MREVKVTGRKKTGKLGDREMGRNGDEEKSRIWGYVTLPQSGI